MVGLYMDPCVYGALSRELRRRGVDVLTVQEDGRSEAPDDEVLDRANELGRVVFTSDPDFIEEAYERQSEGIAFNDVFLAHQLTPIGVCVRDLEVVAACSEPDEWANRVQYVPL